MNNLHPCTCRTHCYAPQGSATLIAPKCLVLSDESHYSSSTGYKTQHNHFTTQIALFRSKVIKANCCVLFLATIHQNSSLGQLVRDHYCFLIIPTKQRNLAETTFNVIMALLVIVSSINPIHDTTKTTYICTL